MTNQQGIYRLSCFDDSVLAAFSGRQFTEAKRTEFLKALGIQQFVRVKQVHGAEIVDVVKNNLPPETLEADALITRERRIAISILTADCIPALFWNSEAGVVAAVHAGWRGLKAGILSKTVQKMKAQPSKTVVSIGPAIRHCCYEVGEEFRAYFPDHYAVPTGKQKGHVDLAGYAKQELEQAGIASQNIHDVGICTACNADKIYSARRDNGSPERIVSVIQIR